MSRRRSEVIVLVGAAVAIAVVILVTLYVLDRHADPSASSAGVNGHQEIGTPADEFRESGSPPRPDRGSHPVPSPG
jgi:hypothetical protein